jgi:hypothetical protein
MISSALQGLQAVLHNPLQPGGYGSVEALKKAILALQAGDTAGADATLAAFQNDARKSGDFTAPNTGGSGDEVFTKLRSSLGKS